MEMHLIKSVTGLSKPLLINQQCITDHDGPLTQGDNELSVST